MHNSDIGSEFDQRVRENVPLAPMTTIGVGGPARYFFDATDIRSLAAGLNWASKKRLPVFVLGGGSNVVIADAGFNGLVIRTAFKGVHSEVQGDEVRITAGAGEDWDALVSTCVSNGWAGFECLSGIPGNVGATPIQNVGAYGQEVSESLVSLRAIDLTTGQVLKIRADECDFGYRTSRFKTTDRNRFIITDVTYRLIANGKPSIRYIDLRLYLDGAGIKSPALADVREAVLTIRRSKAMLIDLADPDSRSVGSFFLNPIVTPQDVEQIKARAAKAGVRCEGMPTFIEAAGKVKLSAAWLIENAGFQKGYLYGKVGISKKHALAIVNRGGASAREVVELAGRIKVRVHATFGVTLAPEPVFLGFEQ